MKNEIEINEYVRTQNGEIHKIIYVEKENIKIKSQYSEWIGSCCIVKHSKQLIDLIEVGDYVNGKEVKHIAMFEEFPNYPKLIFVGETHLIPDDEIKTILTKEQYMANCYKVGGEDEH